MSAHYEGDALTTDAPPTDVTRGNRVESGLVLLLVAMMLMVAAVLRPDEAGFGTHMRLVPVPCIFRWLTGLPCPMCGMSTALAHMARGEVLAALRCHVLGPVAYVGAWLLLGWSGWVLARGTPLIPAAVRGTRVASIALTIVGGAWLVNILATLVA